MARSYRELLLGRFGLHEEREDWFNCVEAIVAEVDPATMAVKVVIPVIDENIVHDEWVDALLPWVGPDGYGPVHPPAIGSEVVLLSRLNEGRTLFYLSRYNEDFRLPQEFADGSRGLKTETALRLLADLLIQIASQQSLLLQAAQRADVKGQAVRLFAGEEEMFRVEGGGAGFRGAAIARRELPPPGPTETPLVTAMRQLLIDLRLAQ